MKKLQRGMIFAVLCSMLIVFLVMIGTIDLGLSSYFRQQNADMTELIEENGGLVPSMKDFNQSYSESSVGKYIEIDDETAFRTRYFVVTMDDSGQVSDLQLDHIAHVDEEDAEKLAQQALARKASTGYIGQYFYRITEKEDSTDLVFLDCTEKKDSLKTTLSATAIVALVLTLIVTVVFSVLSRRILKPFEENNKRQKRFITDASHELKTPLAIISANADVLKFKDGENTWLNNITDQTKHMSELISDLLALTKADEVGTDFVKEEIDLSSLLLEQWESFQGTAEEKKVRMTRDCPEGITIQGSSEMLKRLFSVLFENASKYVSDGGEMKLGLSRNAKTVTVNIFNSAQLSEDFDCSHLFERFYRPDSSRTSSQGGQGIGLSIAEQIVENHKGKISAAKAENGICFTVVLPKNLK